MLQSALARLRAPTDHALQKLDAVPSGRGFAVNHALMAARHFPDAPALLDMETKINLGALGYRSEPLLTPARCCLLPHEACGTLIGASPPAPFLSSLCFPPRRMDSTLAMRAACAHLGIDEL